jgi:exosortase
MSGTTPPWPVPAGRGAASPPTAAPPARAALDRRTAAFILAGLTVLAFYAPVLSRLAVVWWTVPYYSYGFLVPLFSAFLVWDARHRLRTLPIAPWAAGALTAAAGLALRAVGEGLPSLTLQALSLPVVLAGLIQAAFGRPVRRAVAFPLAFLGFMAPLPPAAIPVLSLPLQHLAASAAAAGLRAAGIPVVHEGLLVHLPRVTLEVDESCNGLRFLLAMLVVGTAVAATVFRRSTDRVAVLGSALGLAVLANLVRVTGTGLIAHYLGPNAAVGLPHVVFGKVVYALTAIPLTVLVLARRRREGAEARASGNGPSGI